MCLARSIRDRHPSTTMPRKLKTYVTSIGFFDLAVAAPSMKAALEAWDTDRNLFHQGFATETDEPEIVAAALAKPGVVLRRAVGTRAAFREDAPPPKSLPGRAPVRAVKANPKPLRAAKPAPPRSDGRSEKAAIIQFAKEKERRERDRRSEDAQAKKQEAAQARDEERRRRAVEKVEAVRARARERHDEAVKRLEKERQAIDDRLDAERERWRQEEQALAEQMREARR